MNALASEQADLAADPSDYSVSASNQIQVQALETLGHYADWLQVPTQRLRDLNSLSYRENVVIGRQLTLDFARVDSATFEQRRVAFHKQQQNEFFATYQIDNIENHVIKPGESMWVLAGRTYRVPDCLLRRLVLECRHGPRRDEDSRRRQGEPHNPARPAHFDVSSGRRAASSSASGCVSR